MSWVMSLFGRQRQQTTPLFKKITTMRFMKYTVIKLWFIGFLEITLKAKSVRLLHLCEHLLSMSFSINL